MHRIPLEPGRVALATAGRDEGKLFVIVRVVSEDYVLIVDGETRKVSHPKLKKKKHLKATRLFMDVPNGSIPTDASIRKFLTDSSKKEG